MPRERSYVSPYDLPTRDPSTYTSTASARKKGKLGILKILVLIVVPLYVLINVFGASPAKMVELHAHLKSLTSGEESYEMGGGGGGDENHEEEGNVMMLGPPFVYLRNSVMDIPVQDDDITFFWLTRDSSGDLLKDLLTDCLDLKLTIFHQGVDTEPDLPSMSRTNGIASPNMRDVSALFTYEHYGRMFAFFRHPFHNWKEQSVHRETGVDNPLTRQIIEIPDGVLTAKELGIAKKVIREKCIVGLLDEFFMESIKRIHEYYGWEPKEGTGTACFEKHRSSIPFDHYGELMEDTSQEWYDFLRTNKYDLQLYEFARSVFRAHKQTIIPREKQMALFPPEKEEEKEEQEEVEEEEEEK